MRSEGGVEQDVEESDAWNDARTGGRRYRSVDFIKKDGMKIPIANSISGHERNKLFLNRDGSDFVDVSPVSGADSEADGRSVATLDFNHDGWQDLALVSTNAPHLQLFRNNQTSSTTSTNGFVAIRFVGGNTTPSPSEKWSCRNGFGAVAIVAAGGKSLLRELRCGEGFSAQNSETLIVGIGKNSSADSITVNWPSGIKQTTDEIASGSLVTFFENANETTDETGFQVTSYKSDSVKSSVESTAQPGPFQFAIPAVEKSDAKVKVFFTMATWCAACKAKKPVIEQLVKQLAGEGVSFFGIPIDEKDSAAKLSQYAQRENVPYTILSDIDSEQRLVATGYLKGHLRVTATPSTVVTDGNGQPLHEQLGIPTVSKIRNLLFQLKKRD